MEKSLTNIAFSELESKLKFADKYLDAKENVCKYYNKLTNNIPFSQRLNEWVLNWFDQNKEKFEFTETDEFATTDYKNAFTLMKERFENTGKIYITIGTAPNVFGDSTTHDKFRAWHDYMHIQCNCGFDVGGESIVASVQASKLPDTWLFEKEIIIALICGTNQYYKVHKDYIKDQRKFVSDYLNNMESAIFTEQLGLIDLRKIQ